jgi:NAD(P)H-hydrate epimerase
MAGAAVLAARAALRTGSGLVTVALPASLSPVVATASPEATQILLPELDALDYKGRLSGAFGTRLEKGFDAVAIGPGLGTSPSARLLVELVLNRFSGPQVIDADALNVLAASAETWLAVSGPKRPGRIWTPHPGEFERLTGEKPEGDADRVSSAGRFAGRFESIVVLKGHRTVVHDGNRYYINETGNPGMATGGAGDVLTGVIVSLLGQRFAPFEAACLGVHVHGSAGDFAAEAMGEGSVVAGDIADSLPRALRKHAGCA